MAVVANADQTSVDDLTSSLTKISLTSLESSSPTTDKATSTANPVLSGTSCYICLRIATRLSKKSRRLPPPQRGPSTVCRLCKHLFCQHHSNGKKADKICEIRHESYYAKDRHEKVGENRMNFESLETRRVELGVERVRMKRNVRRGRGRTWW